MRQAAASATCREKPAKFEASNIPESYMRERPSDFGAAQGPGKYGKRQRNKNRRKNQKRGDRRPQLRPARPAQQRGAHPFQRVGDRNQARQYPQRLRQNRNRVHHAADQAGNSQEQPLRWIPPPEEKRIARRNNSQPGKSQDGRQQDQDGAQPVCRARREVKEQNSPP